MRELGEDAEPLHRACGQLAGELALDLIVGVGRLGRTFAEAARLPESQTLAADGPDQAAALLEGVLRSGDLVLFKASRAVGLDAALLRLQVRRWGRTLRRRRRLMLGDLLFSLADQISVFNVFGYVSVRTAMAAATAIVLSLGFGPLVISRLSRLRVGETDPLRRSGASAQGRHADDGRGPDRREP